MAVIQMTSGVPGAGKTYSRVRFLTTDFLINNTGLYITNLPLKVDLIAKNVSKKLSCSKKEILDRIVIIPTEQLKKFQQLKSATRKQAEEYAENGNFPPAEYFESMNLSNAHIALDEFHLYFSKKTARSVKDLWNDWIAEIRKNGCTFEAITQDVSQIPSEFMGKVSVRVDLVPLDITRDPFLHIKMYDWYQLRACFTGQTSQKVCQIETHKGALGRWVTSKTDKFAILPEIYQYYHTSTRNDGRQTTGEIPPYKRLSKSGLILWFIRRNFFSLFSRFLIVCLFIWLTCFGGVSKLMLGFIDGMQQISKSQMISKKSNKSSVSSVSSKASPGKELSPTEKILAEKDAKIKALQEQIELAKLKEIDDHRPAMFFEQKIYLKNGLVVQEKYKFNKGVYNGKIISQIDFSNRCYYLSDGQLISM